MFSLSALAGSTTFAGAAHAVRRWLSSGLSADLFTTGAAQIVIRLSRLATTVTLARLLSPEHVGQAALVLTVYEIIALLTRNGISAKVVQASEDQVGVVAETALSLTWFVCAGLTIVQMALAVPIALVFGNETLALPFALMGLIYLATPLSSIQGAFLQREGRVRRVVIAGAVQVIADNILTALFAIAGFGMWAIVLPKILVAPIWVIFLRYGHPWRSARPFWRGPHLAGAADILRFGRSVVGVELMTTLQANIDYIVVGWVLGSQALGLYYFAFNAGAGITLGIVNAFGIAVFPHLCAARGDADELRRRYRHTLKMLAAISLPIILAQVVLAPVYVPLVFGDKWQAAIPVLMIVCLSVLPRPFASATSQLLKAVGRPDIELRWQLALTVALVLAVLAAVHAGILAVALAVFVTQVVALTAFVLIAPRSVLPPGTGEVAPNDDRFEVVTDEKELGALRSGWEELWRKVPGARVSQGYDWCETGALTIAKPRGDRLWVVVERGTDGLNLVWPLVLSNRRGHLVAKALGSDSTDYDALLVAPDVASAEAVRALHHFVRTMCPADIVEIGFSDETSPRAQVVVADGAWRRSHPIETSGRRCSVYGTAEAQMRALSSKLRNELGRRRRQLAARGAFETGFVSDPATARAAIDWALARKIDWLARRHETNDYLRSPSYGAFLKTMVDRDGACGQLAVMAATLDGRFVAVKIGTVDAARFEGFVTVFDPDLSALAPSCQLLADCLAWCAETGRDYDFRIGNESYKRSWATDEHVVCRWEIANSRRGMAVLAACELTHRLVVMRDRLRQAVPVGLRQRLRAVLAGRPRRTAVVDVPVDHPVFATAE